jgi:hypothetical protein
MMAWFLVLLAAWSGGDAGSAALDAAGRPPDPARPGSQRPAALPPTMTLPRPRTLWRHSGTQMADVLESDGQTLLFVVRKDVDAVAAVDAASGSLRWQTRLSAGKLPDMRDNERLRLERNRLLYRDSTHVAVFALPDGRRLWERAGDNCSLFGSTETHALVGCPGMGPDRDYQLVAYADGKVARTFAGPPGAVGETAAMGTTFVVMHDHTGDLRRLPLGSGAGWTVSIGTSRNGGDELRVVGSAPEIVLVIAPTTTRAFDAERGGLLWQQDAVAAGRPIPGSPIIQGSEAILFGQDQVVARDLRSGRVTRRWALPATPDRGRPPRPRLLVQGERIALRAHLEPQAAGVIFTGTPGAPLVALEEPAPAFDWQLLAGGRLAAINGRREGVLRVYDLTSVRPPLSSMPAAIAIANIEAEMKGEESLCDRWRLVPHAEAYWIEAASRYPGPKWACAMSLLDPKDPRLPPLLRRLAVQVNDDDQMRVLGLLGDDDEPATSALLARLARDPGVKDPGQERRRLNVVAAAYDHLWRTGRTGSTRLCRPGPPRKDPGLLPGDPGLGIGTAHPLFFQAVGRTGAWTHVCQARRDSDGDGQISLTYQRTLHGGHWTGDDVEPYLVVGGGAGRPIEQILAHDPSGRFLAAREGPCLTVLDVSKATVTTLPDADLRGDLGEPPNRVAFDASGRLLAYLRGGQPPRLIVRDLATGGERALDPGPDAVHAVAFTADGRWLALEVGKTGVSGGWLDRPCRLPGSGGGEGFFLEDAPPPTRRRWLPMDGGPAVEGRLELVTPFGDGLLLRDREGALVAQQPSGQRRVIVPADCKGTLVHADPARKSAIAVCAPLAPLPDELMLYHPGGQLRLGRLEGPQLDRWTVPPDRQVRIEGRHIDMAQARLVRPEGPPKLEVVEAPRTEQRGRGVYATRSDGKKLTLPPAATPRSRDLAPRGPLRWR